MAKGNRPEDDTPPRSTRRRRRPPTLELQAREVGQDDKPQAGQASTQANEEPRQAAGEPQGSAWDSLRAQATDHARALVPMPVLTGALGVLAGALVVYLLMPRADGADPRVARLTEEVSTLSAQIESLAKRPLPAPAADQSGLGARIDRLTAAIGEAEQRLAAVEKRPEPKAPDLSSVNQRAAAIESTLKELRSGVTELRRATEQSAEVASSKAVETIAGRIGGLEDRIAALAAARSAPPQGAAVATEIVALNALAAAVREGRPFAKELEAARALLGDRAQALAPLVPFAAAGLPTVEVLERRFADLIPRVLRGPDTGGNFFERLVTNASRIVEVRPVGEPAGNSPAAIVARAETKLARRDLKGAVAEVEALPEPARAAAAEWLAAAAQRRDAEAALQALAETSLAAARAAGKP